MQSDDGLQVKIGALDFTFITINEWKKCKNQN